MTLRSRDFKSLVYTCFTTRAASHSNGGPVPVSVQEGGTLTFTPAGGRNTPDRRVLTASRDIGIPAISGAHR